MIHVVTAQRALAEGTQPAALLDVAEWHRKRGSRIAKALKESGRKRAAISKDGVFYTDLDRARSHDIADKLSDVARDLEALIAGASQRVAA